MSAKHPYTAYEGSDEWTALERALTALVDNGDLSMSTAPEYVIGFLCAALQAKRGKKQDDPPKY